MQNNKENIEVEDNLSQKGRINIANYEAIKIKKENNTISNNSTINANLAHSVDKSAFTKSLGVKIKED